MNTGFTTWADVLQAVKGHQQADLDEVAQKNALVGSLRLAVTSITGTAGCSITQTEGSGRFGTPASDGALALELDQAQYQAGEGPCLSASTHGQSQQVVHLRELNRWPHFREVAVRRGVASSLSLPFAAADGRPGAVNFYGSVPGLYTGHRARLLGEFVTRVAQNLLSDPGTHVQSMTLQRLQQTADDREVIGRAHTLIMDHYGLDATLAYRHLAVRSAEEGSHLIDVAREIVNSPASSHQDSGSSDDRDEAL